jgi:hypothetical protein
MTGLRISAGKANAMPAQTVEFNMGRSRQPLCALSALQLRR